MPAHDANNSTWYVLRYAEDFVPLAGAPADISAPFRDPSWSYLQPTLLFDEKRGALELRPEASPLEARPPAAVAVDVDGEVYRVDDDGVLVVVRCDGSIVAMPCEPNVLAQPAGLALDRRGLLYIADPAAHRVVVLDPHDGSVQAILGGGGPIGALSEPIDVAISSGGFIYVADRAGGRIAVFSSGMKPLASFPTAGAPGKLPRPIAVMVDASGNLLVADAWLPRLLQYEPDGTRAADLDLPTLVSPLAGGDLALGALRRAYGGKMPRFLVGTCGPCATPADDGAARLAEVHRALRLLALSLGQCFEREGVFISRALDGGRPGTSWHRVEVRLRGEPPPGTRVVVETFTSDNAAGSDDGTPPVPDWTSPHDKSGAPIPFTATLPEQLVQSPRGRYLWLRVTLVSDDGHATPSIEAIRVWYPRLSWLDLLPAAYRRDPEAALFLDRFLALFEHVFTGIEDRYEKFSGELNPDAAPREVIDWLAALIDLAFDPSWSVERRRALVGEAMSLYATRGTISGIERYVEIYTGVRPEIVESWLERPARPAFLGRPGAILGCGLPILGCCPSPAAVPEEDLWARYAHRFTIYVYVDDRCDAEVALRAVDRIVEVSKPAHTVHKSEAVFPDARIGIQSRVGLDLVLGTAGASAVRLETGTSQTDAKPQLSGVLGVDSVLGGRRSEYVWRLDGLQ